MVFDDAVVFDSLWGLDAADLDQRAGEYLRQLELDHVVTVTDGDVFHDAVVARPAQAAGPADGLPGGPADLRV